MPAPPWQSMHALQCCPTDIGQKTGRAIQRAALQATCDHQSEALIGGLIRLPLGRYCQGTLADYRAVIYMVGEIPRQGRAEDCHRMSAAMHLIYGSKSM